MHLIARTHRESRSSGLSVTQAYLPVVAAFAVALLAAYQAVVLLAGSIGTLAALPAGLLTFVLVGAVVLVAVARLDEGYISR